MLINIIVLKVISIFIYSIRKRHNQKSVVQLRYIFKKRSSDGRGGGVLHPRLLLLSVYSRAKSIPAFCLKPKRQHPLLLQCSAVPHCWHSPAWLFLVSGPIGTHDYIFVLIYDPYAIRGWASSLVRGRVGLFDAVMHFIRC
jgi:hypothetical protein